MAEEREVVDAPPVDRGTVQQQLIQRLTEGRTEREGHLQKWLRHYQLVDNEHETGKKADWQSKGYVPSLSQAVKFVSGNAKATIVENKDGWAEIAGEGDLSDVVAPVLQTLMYDCLKRHGFAKTLKPNVKAALLTPGMLWKVYPVDGGAWPGDTRVDPVDYRLVVKDPTGAGKWLFFLAMYDYADVERMAESMGWDMDAVRSTRNEGGTDPDAEWKAILAHMMGLPDMGDQYRKRVFLAEYYGPIHDSAGTEVHPFATCTIANMRVALSDPIPEPFGDAIGAIVGEDLDAPLGSAYGKAWAEDGAGLAESMTKLYNAFVDGAVYDMIPIFGVQKNALVNKKQTDGGIRAGMTVQTHGDPSRALVRLDTGNPRANQAMQVYQLSSKEFQAATSATEISRGLAPERGTNSAQTLGEFQMKDAANQQTLSSLSVDLEDNGLAPMVERVVTLVARRVDLRDARVQDIAGRQIAEAMDEVAATDEVKQAVEAKLAGFGIQDSGFSPDDPQVQQLLQQALEEVCYDVLHRACAEGRWTARVRGISSRLARKERAVATLNAVSIIQQTPSVTKIDWEKVPALVCEVNGIDPRDLLKDEQQEAEEAEQPDPPSPALVEFVTRNFGSLAPEVQVASLALIGFPPEVAQQQINGPAIDETMGGGAPLPGPSPALVSEPGIEAGIAPSGLDDGAASGPDDYPAGYEQ